jgi:hypothetical protein
MRSPVLLASIVLASALFAQPVLQYDNVGLPGSVYDLYAIIQPGVSDFDLDGPDADWDFTTSIIDLVGGAVFSLPQNTPYAADYPDADLALLVIYGSDSTYDYFDVTPDGISRLASGLGGAYEQVFTDPSTILQFPFSNGQQLTDDYVSNGSPFSITRTYTGYGTLELVTGTTDNVVKVTASNGERTWYRSDPVEPMLSIYENNTKIVWERITIGMAEQRGLLAMTLAPNPASTWFRIPGLEASATFRVIDALGRATMTGRVSGAQETIDVSALQPGMYRVLVQDARGERAATLMKD